jgi:uncharacterized membrane protein YiaA
VQGHESKEKYHLPIAAEPGPASREKPAKSSKQLTTTKKINGETTNMNWLAIGLIGAIVFVLHAFQQIKITLKEKGYQVDLMTGWFEDYRRFKKLTLEETDEPTRHKYQRILNGLYLALAGLVFIPLLMIMGK